MPLGEPSASLHHPDAEAWARAAAERVAVRVVDEPELLRWADPGEGGEAAVRAGADAGDHAPRPAGLAPDRGRRGAADPEATAVRQPPPDPDAHPERHRDAAPPQQRA